MLKETIRKCIEDFQKDLINELEYELTEKKEASDIDEDDVIDIDTHSHQSQAQRDEQLISDRLARAKSAMDYLVKIPLANSERVSEGALIETSDLFIYVGIITQKFTEEGNNIIGISTDAPIYKTLFNQSVGYHFQLDGVDCEILSIQ